MMLKAIAISRITFSKNHAGTLDYQNVVQYDYILRNSPRFRLFFIQQQQKTIRTIAVGLLCSSFATKINLMNSGCLRDTVVSINLLA